MHVCWATAAQSVATRIWHKRHENAKPDDAGFLPTDGALVWISTDDLSPDDDFLGDDVLTEDGLPRVPADLRSLGHGDADSPVGDP